jgi:hypothetical protein
MARIRSLTFVTLCSFALSCAPRTTTEPAAAPDEPTSPAVVDSSGAEAPARTEPALPRDPFALTVGADGILAPADVALMPAIGAAPLVRLIEPGAEPRTELRYALVEGTKNAMEMAMDMQLALRMGDQPMPTTRLPRMLMVLDVTLSNVTPTDGLLVGKLRSATVDVRTPEERTVGNALAPKLARLAGLATTCTFDRRGFVHDAKLVAPPDLAPELADTVEQMRQSLGAVAVPMPEEPIGIGGSWRVLKRVLAGGIDTVQLSTYTVTARDGDAIVLAAEVAQFAAGRGVANKDVQAQVVRYVSASRGESRLRMSEPFGGSGTAENTSEIEMSMAMGTAEARMTVQATLALSIGPKAEPRKRAKKKR